MRILVTGGSGDLGRLLVANLALAEYVPINLDVSPPEKVDGQFVQGSILDRSLLNSALKNIDCVVHIAAWHGIHEFRHEKDAFDFWDLNVTGTFNLLECSSLAGCSKFVFISSTSVDEWPGIYGHSKVIGEDLMRTYAERHGMSIVSLRPRASIPHWNRSVYKTFPEWANWYWKGAVHISDVAQSVVKAVNYLSNKSGSEHLILTIDGACDFTDSELANWDANGPGSTFKQKFGEEYFRLADEFGLDTAAKPKILGYSQAASTIKYKPEYGFAQMLEELADYKRLFQAK